MEIKVPAPLLLLKTISQPQSWESKFPSFNLVLSSEVSRKGSLLMKKQK